MNGFIPEIRDDELGCSVCFFAARGNTSSEGFAMRMPGRIVLHAIAKKAVS
jgi:hypothetical protein